MAPPQNLDLDLLRAFVTVADAGGFTRAAGLLNRTQPAVSLQIRRLETQLDRPLFDRGAPGATLTVEGAAFLPQARRLLRINDEIVAGMGEGDMEGEVRFGAPEDIATAHLPAILGEFSRTHPRISLVVTCDYTANLLDMIGRGALDLALVKREPLGPDLGVSVWKEPLLWVASDAAVLEQDPLPLVIAPAPDVYRKRAIAALQAEGRAFRVAYTSPSLSGQLAALKAGLGVGVQPAALTSRDLLDVSKRLPVLEPTEIALVTARGRSGPASLLAETVMARLERH